MEWIRELFKAGKEVGEIAAEVESAALRLGCVSPAPAGTWTAATENLWYAACHLRAIQGDMLGEGLTQALQLIPNPKAKEREKPAGGHEAPPLR